MLARAQPVFTGISLITNNISSLTTSPGREEQVEFPLPYVLLEGSENIAIAVQEGDEALRLQMDLALLRLKADGVLQTIIAAIGDDVPEWEPTLALWPRVNLPVVVGGSGE